LTIRLEIRHFVARPRRVTRTLELTAVRIRQARTSSVIKALQALGEDGDEGDLDQGDAVLFDPFEESFSISDS